ncbi:MAG TPA: hypothetical protein VHZ28_03345 [Terracidiphilus sp.]|nr:hypothetical protein [Terracidiphilus sp.]
MKLLLLQALAVAALATVSYGIAQTPPQNSTPQAPAAQPSAPSPSEPSSPKGKVIFSRSADENGSTTTQGSAAPASEPTATDAERLAVSFTALDLDVHVQSAAHRIAVRANLTVRNNGKTPLTHIPLQISSTLNWEQIRVAGHNTAYPVATLNSDTDHTGQLHEAAVPLATPLAPGATVALDVVYSGAIVASAQRLLTLGTPESVALHSDWDEVSPEFTGLRGFGNVAWYPVSTVPVILGDGSRVFDEIGRHKLSLSQAQFRVHLTVEFPHGTPPTIALVNGLPVALQVADAAGLDADVPGIATASFESPAMGFVAPSLFVAVRTPHAVPNLTAYTTPENDISVQTWLTEDVAVTPFVQEWLGRTPRTALTLLDLPDPKDAPYETGALLATGLHVGPQSQLDSALVHALAHAAIASPQMSSPAWLNEGIATFLESMWVEKQHGRDRALQSLESDRGALALVEPASPAASPGEPLALATAPVYYRTKAAYVLWMLRDLTSDEALGTALRGLVSTGQNASAAESLQALLKQAGASRDLTWFFSDWVNEDKGLPDLTINSVFPNAAQAGTYLVAVNISNSGYAATDVPVTVRTAKGHVTERIFIPARSTAVERLVVMGPPTQVQVNDGTVPETTASIHTSDVNIPEPDAPTRTAPSRSSSSSSASTPNSAPPQ